MKAKTQNNPKLGRLARRLNLPIYAAAGILEMLWLFTREQAPAGDIGRWDDADIAAAVTWDREPKELITALVAERWLDNSKRHRLVIHDWSEHADDAVHRTVARLRILFADQQRPRLTKLQDKERAEAQEFYSRPGRPRAPRGRPMGASPVPSRPVPPVDKELGGEPPVRTSKDLLAEEFEKQIRPAYPERDGDQRWIQALSSYRAARKGGASFEVMRDGLGRYVQWCHQRGIVGTASVKQAASFFGREKCWQEPWVVTGVKKPNGCRKLKLVSGREIDVPSGKRIEWTDNPQACDAYELPNGTLSVKSGAQWVSA